MTPEEAIEILGDFGKQAKAKADGAYQTNVGKIACDMAIEAIKEIQQYREIGTVEDLKSWCSLFGLNGFKELEEYKKIVTYILDTENGSSLRAAGWNCAGLAGGKRWTGSRRPAADLCPAQMKYRFEKHI